MGLFDLVGDFVSGAIGFVGEVFSGVGKVLTGAVNVLTSLGSTVGGLLGGVFSKAAGLLGTFGGILAGPLGMVLGPILVQLLVHFAGKVMQKIAQKLGLIKEEDKVEEIGYRMEKCAEHPDWKRPEDFESFEDWNEYMKEMVPSEEIDQDELRRNLTRFTVSGTVALEDAWAQKIGLEIPKEFLVDTARAKIQAEDVELIAQAFQSIGSKVVLFHDFLTDKMTVEETMKVQEAIVHAFQERYQDKSAVDIYAQIDAWKKAATDDETVHQNYKKEADDIQADIKKEEAAGTRAEDVVIDVRKYGSDV